MKDFKKSGLIVTAILIAMGTFDTDALGAQHTEASWQSGSITCSTTDAVVPPTFDEASDPHYPYTSVFKATCVNGEKTESVDCTEYVTQKSGSCKIDPRGNVSLASGMNLNFDHKLVLYTGNTIGRPLHCRLRGANFSMMKCDQFFDFTESCNPGCNPAAPTSCICPKPAPYSDPLD